MRISTKVHRKERAFSLVEVVLALGIVVFALVALVGLFTTALQASRESEEQAEAANLATLLISCRRAAPLADLPEFAIPAAAMRGPYGNAYGEGAPDRFVGLDGSLVDSAEDAACTIRCWAGTNSMTGGSLAQIYIRLARPFQGGAVNRPPDSYEVLTYIPLR